MSLAVRRRTDVTVGAHVACAHTGEPLGVVSRLTSTCGHAAALVIDEHRHGRVIRLEELVTR